MSDHGSNKPARLSSATELEVFNALSRLPDGYTIEASPARISFDYDGAGFRYEPDFIVTSPDGSQLIIDVKSSASLSLMNLAKLVEINKRVEKYGAHFLLIIFDGRGTSSLTKSTTQIENLNVSYVHNFVEIQEAVINALVSSPGTGHS
jgi:hypothetical protein